MKNTSGFVLQTVFLPSEKIVKQSCKPKLRQTLYCPAYPVKSRDSGNSLEPMVSLLTRAFVNNDCAQRASFKIALNSAKDRSFGFKNQFYHRHVYLRRDSAQREQTEDRVLIHVDTEKSELLVNHSA